MAPEIKKNWAYAPETQYFEKNIDLHVSPSRLRFYFYLLLKFTGRPPVTNFNRYWQDLGADFINNAKKRHSRKMNEEEGSRNEE